MDIFHPLSSLRISLDTQATLRRRDLVLHLHGSHDIVRAAVRARFPDAIAASINLNGLSGAYQAYFGSSPHYAFVRLLAEIQQATNTESFETITLSSFSAGYGGLRVLLQDRRCVDLVSQIVLADTVYASFGEQQNSTGVRPFPNQEQNKPFIEFGKLAVKGLKGMLLSHCELVPDTYASTEEVGMQIRDGLNAPLVMVDERWNGGLRIKGKAMKGRFVSFATRGSQAGDHLAHLRALETWYRLLPRI